MKKSITVTNLTLDLWMQFVRPALRAADMLEEVPAKDDWHEYTAEVIDEAIADEIAHCMKVACFNAHGNGKYTTIEEAAQMVYQMEVSIKYRPITAEALTVIKEAIAAKIAEVETCETAAEVEQMRIKTNMKKTFDFGKIAFEGYRNRVARVNIDVELKLRGGDTTFTIDRKTGEKTITGKTPPIYRAVYLWHGLECLTY